MKILRLTAENIKKLKVVEIVPDGSVVQITGPNGSGKSSVLDAIYYALAGTSHIPSEPIRKGTEKASIKLDLGEVVVTRKFSGESTQLIVEAQNGARFPSPQKMLDDLLGALAFDPLEFSRMEPKAQLECLRGLVPLEEDIDALDRLNKADFDERTIVNRRVKDLTAQVEAISVDPNLPAQPVDVSALTAEMESAAQANAERERARATGERRVQDAKAKLQQAQQFTDEANRLMLQVEEARSRAEKLQLEHKAITDELAAMPALAPIIDTAPLRERIDAAGAINKAIDLREGKRALRKQLDESEQLAQALTRQIDGRNGLKQKAIASAAMPVPGLSFGDGQIIYNGLPLEQASSAEQLRISVGIAMAANPKLRVIRIKDGSLLDEANLALLAEMAQAGDYQIWIERVDASGKVGIVMEDGQVKEVKS